MFYLRVGIFIIFRPTFSMGEENHDLCCVFFPNFAKTPPYTNSTYSASLLSLPLNLPTQPPYSASLLSLPTERRE